VEELDYKLPYRWFVGLAPNDTVWNPTTFTKNRAQLENGEVFTKFMAQLLNHPEVKPLLSDEHFSVDGTLIEAWASHKSFRPKDGSGDGDDGANFRAQKRKNDTHASVTDPDRRLYRKAAGREASSAKWDASPWRIGIVSQRPEYDQTKFRSRRTCSPTQGSWPKVQKNRASVSYQELMRFAQILRQRWIIIGELLVSFALTHISAIAIGAKPVAVSRRRSAGGRGPEVAERWASSRQ
jgi:hypothetical protein